MLEMLRHARVKQRDNECMQCITRTRLPTRVLVECTLLSSQLFEMLFFSINTHNFCVLSAGARTEGALEPFYQESATDHKIAVIVDQSWSPITAKLAHGVALTSPRRSGRLAGPGHLFGLDIKHSFCFSPCFLSVHPIVVTVNKQTAILDVTIRVFLLLSSLFSLPPSPFSFLFFSATLRKQRRSKLYTDATAISDVTIRVSRMFFS